MKKAANRASTIDSSRNAFCLARSVFVSNTRDAGLPKSGEHKFKKWLFVVQRRSACDVERKFWSAEEGPSTHYHYFRLRSRGRTQSIWTLHALLRLVRIPQYDTLPLAKF